MGDEPPVNLGLLRARKGRDARMWSVAEALRDALADVESGRIDADMVYVAFRTKPDADGAVEHPSTFAGGKWYDAVALLAVHNNDVLDRGIPKP